MAAQTLVTHRRRSGTRTWELELDAELVPSALALTEERAQALARLLERIPDIDVFAVRPHCDGRYVLVSLAVEAPDLPDAVDLGVAYLRSSALAAGVGELILVAARCPVSRG